MRPISGDPEALTKSERQGGGGAMPAYRADIPA